jgi:cysteine desulfurase|tara:strand:+ start:2250 stop:3416 length:1167 start_codon:yes stop_codon:yes gene_type:complete
MINNNQWLSKKNNLNSPIYLDYAATTPVDVDVLEEMLPFFSQNFGNAGSATHQHGWYANGAVKRARKQIAKSINCEETEVIFTSGATESINLAMKGVYDLYSTKGEHIVISKTEHTAVLDTAAYLQKKGAKITYLDVDENGKIDSEDLKNAITERTILIAVMWVNNETGVVQDCKKLSEIAYQNNIPFLCDATQALGKLKIDLADNHIGLMPISSHKIFGPKGVGALYVRRKKPRISLESLVHGGGQERGLRAGTLNVPGIVGFGVATLKNTNNLNSKKTRIKDIKSQFLIFFKQYNVIVNGNQQSSDYILNIRIPGLKASQLIKKTRNISYSLGSACNADSLNPSHVLVAMGLTKEECEASFRLSFSAAITDQEIKEACAIFKQSLL